MKQKANINSLVYQSLVILLENYTNAQNSLDELETHLNSSFLKTVERHKADYADAQVALSNAAACIETLCSQNPEWFVDSKTIKTPFGSVGFRASTSLDVTDEERSIILIQNAAFKNAELLPLLTITVALDREALEKLTDAELARYGITRSSKENFTIKPAKVDMGKLVKKEAPLEPAVV